MINRKDLTSRVIRLLKLDITTFLTSLSPILSLYILGGFIDKEIISVFGFTYAFQFLWGMFSRGLNHPIFLYAFKDIKNDKNKTMSIVFSGCSVFFLLEVVAYLLFLFSTKQYLILLKVPNELIDICYIYTIYAIAAIGLQVIDFMVFSYYEYTGRLEQNNKLGFLYALIRVGGALLYVFLNKSMTLHFTLQLCILILPLTSFTLTILLKMLSELKQYKIHFTWEFLKGFKYGTRDILKDILNTIGNFVGTRNTYLAGTTAGANGSTAFQYAFITTITDVQWDCNHEGGTLVLLDIASESIKYNRIHQINDKRLTTILKVDIIAGYIVFGMISILGFLVLGTINHFLPITKYMLFNMTFDLIGMILYTPHYAISSLLNALGVYRELTIIAFISVIIRIFGSSIESIYAVNIGMILGVILNYLLTMSLFLYYKHKYKNPKEN